MKIRNTFSQDISILEQIFEKFNKIADTQGHTYDIVGYIWYPKNEKSLAIQKLEKCYSKRKDLLIDLYFDYAYGGSAIYDYLHYLRRNAKIADHLIAKLNCPCQNAKQIHATKVELTELFQKQQKRIDSFRKELYEYLHIFS